MRDVMDWVSAPCPSVRQYLPGPPHQRGRVRPVRTVFNPHLLPHERQRPGLLRPTHVQTMCVSCIRVSFVQRRTFELAVRRLVGTSRHVLVAMLSLQVGFREPWCADCAPMCVPIAVVLVLVPRVGHWPNTRPDHFRYGYGPIHATVGPSGPREPDPCCHRLGDRPGVRRVNPRIRWAHPHRPVSITPRRTGLRTAKVKRCEVQHRASGGPSDFLVSPDERRECECE